MRDSIVQPNVGNKWVLVWTPLLLTLFLFILVANLIGVIPVFDVLELLNSTVIHAGPDSFFTRVLHGGVTVTGNYNVTAALATVTFFAIIVAGARAHGFVKHWKNMVPKGLPWPIYILIPIEIMGMFVRPFALTMRLAANMTGGHIAILAILSFVLHLHAAVRPRDRRRRRRHGAVAADRGRPDRARAHRDPRSGVRLHAVDGRVHRHGHPRSSLSIHTEE